MAPMPAMPSSLLPLLTEKSSASLALSTLRGGVIRKEEEPPPNMAAIPSLSPVVATWSRNTHPSVKNPVGWTLVLKSSAQTSDCVTIAIARRVLPQTRLSVGVNAIFVSFLPACPEAKLKVTLTASVSAAFTASELLSTEKSVASSGVIFTFSVPVAVLMTFSVRVLSALQRLKSRCQARASFSMM